MRRPAIDYFILGKIPGRIILDILGHVKKFKQSLEFIPGHYVVIEAVNNSIKHMLYTRWNYRYDIHCDAQILGRRFLLDVEIVNIREDYLAGLIRAPFLYFEAGPFKERIYRLDTGEEVERFKVRHTF